MLIVDTYKRLTEGPFRHLAWSMRCLQANAWADPPMLTSLGEQLRKAGGNLGILAAAVIVPGLRNSEAHEAIAWDGYTERIIASGESIHPHNVAEAVVLADAFTRGAEAGLAIARSLALTPEQIKPRSNEPNRMASWRRVQAFFGTNRLRLVAGTTNSRHPRLTLDALDSSDINPCFQALTAAHLLIPQVDRFTIGTLEEPDLITVSANAIASNLPIWDHATSRLDRMPFSAFLVINLDARRAVEDDKTAIRAAAWIATDDALDAIDGMTSRSPTVDGAVLRERLAVIEVALQCLSSYWKSDDPRVASVSESVRTLRIDLGSAAEISSRAVKQNPATRRIKTQWRAWGPVRRHPLIAMQTPPTAPEIQPNLRNISQNTGHPAL